MLRKSLFSILLFLNSFLLSAQSFKVQELTVADGLSQGMIMAHIQDKQGFMWFATRAGLDRYDGYRFKHYTHSHNDTTSLAENIVICIKEDRKGRLWILTENGGVDCFDPKTEIFHHLRFDFNTFGMPNLRPLNVHFTTDGHVWFTTKKSVTELVVPDRFPAQPQSRAALRYTMYAVGRNLPLPAEAEILPDLLVEGTLGIACKDPNVFLRFNPKRRQWESHPLEQKLKKNLQYLNHYNVALEEPLWYISNRRLQCWHNDGVVFEASLAQQFEGYDSEEGAIVRDKRGNFWMSIGLKLFYLPVQDLHKVPIQPVQLLNNLSFTSLVFDRQQRLWVGTSGYGLRTIATDKARMEHWLPGISAGAMHPYSEKIIINKNALAFTTDGASVPLPEEFLNTFSSAGSAAPYRVSCVIHSVKGQSVIKVFDRGRQTRQFPGRFPCTGNEQLMIDRRGALWAAFNDGQLAWLPTNAHQVHYYNYRQLWQQPQSTQIKTLYESADGHIWLATTQGLVEILPANDSSKLKMRLRQSKGPGQLNNNAVLCVADDPNQPDRFLWVGTNGGGLNRLDKRTGRCSYYTKENGLPDNVVYGILPDNDGNLWLSTNFGLSRFNPAKQYFRNYTAAEDGLQDNEFNTASFLKLPDGRLLFGGINGISVFHPKDFRPDTSAVSVFFTELKVNNHPVTVRDSTGILQQPIEQIRRLSLKYDQNFLSLAFAALDFKQMGKSSYYYKMEGVDADWVFGGQKTEVSYPNLSPGTYTLYVANVNEAGDRNALPAVITFEISPPWWRSWWAYLIYGLGLAGVAYGYFQFHLRRAKLQNELLFKEKEAQQLQEMDELKSRFFSNITHEFRTPLTLIIEPARQLQTANDWNMVKTQAGIIYNNSNRLLILVNQLLDIAKLEAGKVNLHWVEGDLLPLLREVYEYFLPLAQKKQQTLLWEAEVSELKGISDRQILEKTTFNLLSNALKFTPEGGSISLKVKMVGNDRWQMTVADSGIGISPTQLPHIFDRFYQADGSHTRRGEGTGIGLALVKELTELAGGKIDVQSTLGQGTQFTLTFPQQPASIAEAEPLNGQTTSVLTRPIEDLRPIASTATAGSAKNILVVEDNPEMRHYLRLVLQQNGFSVLEAVNGAEGIETAREAMPDLVISDIMMPEKDGYELTDILKNELLTSHIPIVLLTAKGKPESKLEGYRRGADAYLSKPFNTDELLVRIRQLLDVRQILQQKYSERSTVNPLAMTPPEDVSMVLPHSPLDAAFMERIYSYIEENLNNRELSIDNLTEEFAMSRSQLFRKVTSLTNMPPARLIRNYRLTTALRLLQQDKTSKITDVMAKVGFEDTKYFSRVFKEHFGFSPQSVAEKNPG
ncbi:MAG: ATP-binding protein [Spirosomataceae bacterium]